MSLFTQKLNIDMTTWPAQRFGHGSRLHATEPPYISPDDDTILEPGMILHIEPGCIEKDGIYVLEEQVLVTESGSKVLSHVPWELQAKKNELINFRVKKIVILKQFSDF